MLLSLPLEEARYCIFAHSLSTANYQYIFGAPCRYNYSSVAFFETDSAVSVALFIFFFLTKLYLVHGNLSNFNSYSWNIEYL